MLLRLTRRWNEASPKQRQVLNYSGENSALLKSANFERADGAVYSGSAETTNENGIR
jgi:hypothetical protein